MQPLADDALDGAADVGVAQLAFGLPLELRFGQLHGDHRGEAFADVVADQVGLAFLEHLGLVGVVVQHAGQRGAEAGQVGAAVDRVDAVGKAVGGFVEAVVVLYRHLDHHVAELFLVIHRFAVAHRAVAVQVPDETGDAALEVEA